MPRELPAGVIVRAANAEEMEEFRFVANIALAEHGVPERDPVTYLRPEWSTCVFEHGQLATTFGAWPFSMRFNGERAAIAGVTAVGTLPTKRRRGYLRAAMEYSLTEQYERGQSLAALYASQAAIYQRFGYAVCSNRCSYEIDPLDLHFIHYPEPRGELTVSNAADLPDDAQVIRESLSRLRRAAPRTGSPWARHLGRRSARRTGRHPRRSDSLPALRGRRPAARLHALHQRRAARIQHDHGRTARSPHDGPRIRLAHPGGLHRDVAIHRGARPRLARLRGRRPRRRSAVRLRARPAHAAAQDQRRDSGADHRPRPRALDPPLPRRGRH